MVKMITLAGTGVLALVVLFGWNVMGRMSLWDPNTPSSLTNDELIMSSLVVTIGIAVGLILLWIGRSPRFK